MMRVLPLVCWFVAGAWLLGCTSMLGIDGDYVREPSASAGNTTGAGGRSSGGSDSGGRTADGGAPASGGGGVSGGGMTTGSGGVPAGGTEGGLDGSGEQCVAGQKLCTVTGEERCVAPDPSVGCGPSGCDQCLPPTGGYGMCEGTSCSFGCFDGFVRSGDACEPVTVPDAGHSGTGGRPSSCRKDADCPACGSVLGCCALIPTGKCGCNFVWCVASPP
jgi:hypothetical protein